MRNRIAFLVPFFFLASVAWSQQSSGDAQSGAQSMPGMDMPAHDMSNMHMQKNDMPMSGDKDTDIYRENLPELDADTN